MKIRHLVASQPRVKTQTSKDGIGHRSAAAVRTLAGLHASQPSIAVFPILADVVEVKTGSGSTVHWPIHFIRLNGWLRHSFVQLITLLDIDSIGQNWEDRKKHDKCTNVIGQRWSLGRSIEPIEGRTGSSFCRSQGTVERRRRRRWRPVAPRTRRPRRADEGGPSLPHWPPGNTNGTSRDQTAARPVCPTSHAPSGGRRRNSGRRALPSPR